MEKMKRAILFLAILLLLVGCGGRQEDNGSKAYSNDSENTAEGAVNTFQSGSKYKIVTPMMELKEAVENSIGEKYWPDTLLTDEEFSERTGISEDLYKNFMAEYQRSEAGIDMMILVEVREDSLEAVENYLEGYRSLLLKIYENQPQNEAKVYASRIETINHYVCYVQLGADITGLKELGRDEMIAYCQEENERAIDILERKIRGWEGEAE